MVPPSMPKAGARNHGDICHVHGGGCSDDDDVDDVASIPQSAAVAAVVVVADGCDEENDFSPSF